MRIRLRIACRVAAAALAGAVAVSAGNDAPALAQDPATPAQAREKFRQGLALEASGDWERALATFREVARVKSTPQVRYHIGQCEEKAGNYVGALDTYRMAIMEAREAKARDVLSSAQEALSALERRGPKLVIQRGEGAAAADVTLDGEALGTDFIGASMAVNPGPHIVKATAPGREATTVELTVWDRDMKTVELVLPPAKASPPPPPPALPVPAREAAPAVRSSSSPLKTIGFIVGGAGVASLGVAGVFFAMRQGAISELDGQCATNGGACPADAKSTLDRGKTFSTVSAATFIGGVAGLTVGGVMVIAAPSSKSSPGIVPGKERAWDFEPGAPSAPAGATIRGRF